MQLQPASLGQYSLTEEIDGLLARSPRPTSGELAEFLKLYHQGAARDAAARALIAKGVDANEVGSALAWVNASAVWLSRPVIWGVLATVSMAASAYHGYRRNQSVGWAVWWALMGLTFPVLTPAIGLAQGFGKRKAT